MTIWYLLMAIMLVLFAVEYLENDRKDRADEITVFLVVLMTALSGARGDMGADLSGYLYFFTVNPPLDRVLFAGETFNPDENLEPLYALIVSTFKVFSGNFNLFLGVQSLILLLLVVKSLRRLRAPVNIGLILYFFLFYLSHFGQQRMAIVYVLCFLASTYVVTSEPIKFVAIVVAATLIQYTAILFLPAYALRYVLLSGRRNGSSGAGGAKSEVAPATAHGPSAAANAYTLNGKTLFKVAIGLVGAGYATVRLDIFRALYDTLTALQGGLAANIYAFKFISYYERINMDLNLLNAWFGITANLAIIVFLYLYRGLWLASRMAPVFAMFAFGLVVIVAVYKFPWLGDRVFRMYSIGALVGLFAVIVGQRKGAQITLPFVLAICIYEYLSHIATETEVYRFAGF